MDRSYQEAVKEQQVTKDLIEKTIQANPETVVEEEWNVTVDNGVVTPN